ncbi:Hsp20/alpha crystallin family protein [Camelliibacillus cellulosilyticus]|uniref:Hsp20/alpha crystallin family protein n=1 Tax=Camelliibacillus cellulosilyticus TaxID=2174486 RepID=A0ABV9GKH7_9BACL
MALIPYEPFHQLDRLRNTLDEIFPSSFYTNDLKRYSTPSIDIHETDKEVVASCDLPGLEKKEDIDIDVKDNTLTLKGTVRRSNEMKEDNIRRSERFYGRFQRSVTLPTAVDESMTTATYKNGVLEIRMPKRHGGTNHRIQVDFH